MALIKAVKGTLCCLIRLVRFLTPVMYTVVINFTTKILQIHKIECSTCTSRHVQILLKLLSYIIVLLSYKMILKRLVLNKTLPLLRIRSPLIMLYKTWCTISNEENIGRYQKLHEAQILLIMSPYALFANGTMGGNERR